MPIELLKALLDCDYIRRLEPISVDTLRSVERHVSAVYQVRIQFRKGHGLYWIKVDPRKSGSSQQEYDFLCNTYKRFRHIPHLTVLQPVAYLKAFDALVTMHSEGKPLSTHVKHGMNMLSADKKSGIKVKHNFYLCGKWLAKLHGQQLDARQYYTWEELFEYIDIRLKWLLADWGLDAVFYERVLAYFDNKRSELSSIRLIRVKTHGDYAPYNVLVTEDGIAVFDPSVGQYFGQLDNYCSQYEDIVHFYKWSQEMYSHFVSRRVRSELVSRFIEGYNDNIDLAVSPASAAFEVFMVKYKTLSVFDTWPSVISKIKSRKARINEFEQWFDKITRRA